MTDPLSVADGVLHCHGLGRRRSAVIVNAGIAAVAPLTELPIDTFRRLERVNIEGTLLTIAEAGRLFKIQKTGGDIVLVDQERLCAGREVRRLQRDQAASHQLARIASLELADIDVRVNMVAPDAVFSHGKTKSRPMGRGRSRPHEGARPGRKGLQEYYHSRNLLKTAVGRARGPGCDVLCHPRRRRRRPGRRFRSMAACRMPHHDESRMPDPR